MNQDGRITAVWAAAPASGGSPATPTEWQRRYTARRTDRNSTPPCRSSSCQQRADEVDNEQLYHFDSSIRELMPNREVLKILFINGNNHHISYYFTSYYFAHLENREFEKWTVFYTTFATKLRFLNLGLFRAWLMAAGGLTS